MRKKGISGKMIASVAAFILVVAAIFAGAMIFEHRDQKGDQEALEALKARVQTTFWTEDNTVLLGDDFYGFDHRIETFLFVGTDNSGTGNDDPDDYRGPMADFLLLMVIDHTDNTIGYIQIDRNTVTEVNELDFNGDLIAVRDLQICTAHWYGRNPEMCAENTVEAVKAYLGALQNIDGYFVINMDDIGTLNHTVGGVEVTIQDDLDADDSTLIKGETLLLDDAQAEHFLRARINVEGERNADRMARQRQYMSAFFEKVRTKTMENPKFGLELWDMLKDVSVSNMNGNDFSRIAQKLLKGEDKGVHTIKGETVLGYILEDGLEHEEFYTDMDSLREVMVDMFSLTHIDEDDPYFFLDDEEDLDEDDEDYDDEDDEDDEDDDDEENDDDEDEDTDGDEA